MENERDGLWLRLWEGEASRLRCGRGWGRRVVKCPYGSRAGTKALPTGARTQADSVEWCYFSGHKELDLPLWQTDTPVESHQQCSRPALTGPRPRILVVTVMRNWILTTDVKERDTLLRTAHCRLRKFTSVKTRAWLKRPKTQTQNFRTKWPRFKGVGNWRLWGMVGKGRTELPGRHTTDSTNTITFP